MCPLDQPWRAIGGVDALTECSLECFVNSGCTGFAYKTLSQTCELHTSLMTTSIDSSSEDCMSFQVSTVSTVSSVSTDPIELLFR